MIKTRSCLVLLSFAIFCACLCENAYDTAEHTANTANSGLSNFLVGWIALPIAAFSLFAPYPVIIVIIAAMICYHRQLFVVSYVLGVFAIVGMIFSHALGFASWLSNLILFASWACIFFYPTRTVFFITGSATLLALSFLSISELPLGSHNEDVPVLSYHAGYWLWVLASGTMAFGSGALWCFEQVGIAATHPSGREHSRPETA